jgi:PAS domain S-box-containing protein
MNPSVFDTDALFRLLVAQVEDYAIFALDTEGRVRTWNPGAERFKGYTADEIIGRDFSIFYPPESVERQLPRTLLKEALDNGHALDEGWRVRKDGSRFWASVVITALRDEQGRHVGFAKITRDLTERRAAEARQRRLAAQDAVNTASQALTEELEAANEQLQATLVEAEEARDALAAAERFARGILESIADPFIVLDAKWCYRFVNAAAAQLLEPSHGLAPGGLIGRSMWDLYPDIRGTVLEADIRRAVEEGKPRSFEAYSSARARWSLLHCYPLPDGGLAIQWRDITERKRIDEANHYLTRASDILNRSLDYEVTLNDLAHLIVPELADWCAVDISDSSGVLERVAVAHVDPEKVRFARQLSEQYPSGKNEQTGLYAVLRSGQPERYPEITDALLVAGARDPEHLRIMRALGLKSAMLVPLLVGDVAHGVLTLVSTESGRRYQEADEQLAMELAHRAAIAVQNAQLHRAARDAQRVAEEANRAKSEFLATMSHELRTPLNAIGGYVELLRLGLKGPVTPDQDEYLARIERSEKYLLSLIQDVLSFAKIEAGRVDLRPERVGASRLLDEVASLVAPQLETAQLRFAAGPLPADADVFADPERVRQILLNLLTNAIKFTGPGGAIRVSCEADGDVVKMRVHDTGIGIPQDKLDSIFEPFVQLERGDRGSRAGAGLGLAISRDLARAMSGDLTVESALGRGSTFTLSLPRTGNGTSDDGRPSTEPGGE